MDMTTSNVLARTSTRECTDPIITEGSTLQNARVQFGSFYFDLWQNNREEGLPATTITLLSKLIILGSSFCKKEENKEVNQMLNSAIDAELFDPAQNTLKPRTTFLQGKEDDAE